PQQLVSLPTRDLGLRPSRPATEDEPTGQVEIQRLTSPRKPARAVDPTEARIAEILETIDRDAPANESKDDHTRRRIQGLIEHAQRWSKRGDPDDPERSVAAVELALEEEAASSLAQKLVHRNRDAIMNVFQTYLGDLQRQPVLARPLHELASAPINPRAAFLLSRVDGVFSLDEILDVSGMPRLEAYRYLCQLYSRGILR
ncbi:MAG: hypothetical protein NT062_08265, partial [Proteobacteria bacterium]|nr:hypothetical protein [Pseudomonadota bacterium]